MNKLLSYLLAFLSLSEFAHAGKAHMLNGVFCQTEAQARMALELFDNGLSMPAAVMAVNHESVGCVLADSIKYVITQPVIIESGLRRGIELTLYGGRAIAILVGENPRELEPPVPIYFVLNRKLDDAARLSGT